MKTIIIDTNFLFTILLKTIKINNKQFKKNFYQIEKGEVKGLVSILVINKIIWILENFYELSREDFLPKIMTLLALKNFKIIEIKKSQLEQIFNLMKSKNIDFTDSHLLTNFSKEKIFSFDGDLR